MKTCCTIVKWLILALCLFMQTGLYSQIVNIEERRITGTNDTTNWYGFVRLGANISKVKDQVFQLNATGQVQYKSGKSMVLLLLDARFLRAGNQDFNRSGFSHLRYNYKLTDRLVTEAYVQAQYNKLLLIRLRALSGAGLRYRIFKSENNEHRIYSGLAYLYEHTRFLEEWDDRNWSRLSSYISFTFRPAKGIKLVNTTYFQPQLERFSNYRMSTEWRLDMPLVKKLSFFTEFSFSIDKSLPEDVPSETYFWMNGMTYKF